MSTLTLRRVIAMTPVLLLVAALLATAYTAVPDATAAAPAVAGAATLTGWYEMPVPPEILARLDAGANEPFRLDMPPRPAQAPVITLEGFEDQTFPPTGWEVIDNIAATAGVEDRLAWGRVTCQKAHGEAATWMAGGGTIGSGLGCWSPYTETVRTFLVYPNIDTSDYPGGLNVNFLALADWPPLPPEPRPPDVRSAMQVCRRLPGQTTWGCGGIAHTEEQRNHWVTLGEEGLTIPDTGGLQGLGFAILYEDTAPTGQYRGAIVDDVLLQGVGGAQQPTNTSVPTTPRPTRPPTNTPVPSATPRAGFDNFMPLVMNRAAKADIPPYNTAPPATPTKEAPVEVILGLNLNPLTGELGQPGTVFQFGVMEMCEVVRWTNLPIGTEIRWQWYQDDKPLEAEGLNETVTTARTEGSVGTCIYYSNRTTGARVPIPVGVFAVDAWAGDVSPGAMPVATGQAIVQEEVPPGATPLPDPGTYACRDVLVNGNFEQGPDVGWEVESNGVMVGGEPLSPKHLIRSNDDFPDSDPAREGSWLAIMGGNPNFEMQMRLRQIEEFQLLEPTEVISAALKFWVAQVSDEQPDDEPGDKWQVDLMNQDGDREPLAGSSFSEETIVDRRWFHVEIPFTDLIVKREGWSTLRVEFFSEVNATAGTSHLVDGARLEICQPSQPATAAEVAALRAAARLAEAAGARWTIGGPVNGPRPTSPGDALIGAGYWGDVVRAAR